MPGIGRGAPEGGRGGRGGDSTYAGRGGRGAYGGRGAINASAVPQGAKDIPMLDRGDRGAYLLLLAEPCSAFSC